MMSLSERAHLGNHKLKYVVTKDTRVLVLSYFYLEEQPTLKDKVDFSRIIKLSLRTIGKFKYNRKSLNFVANKHEKKTLKNY